MAGAPALLLLLLLAGACGGGAAPPAEQAYEAQTAAPTKSVVPVLAEPLRTQPSLVGALLDYENGLLHLVTIGRYEERAAAIQALAEVASPSFPAARQTLAADPDSQVQVALLRAMAEIGDGSEEARGIAERKLLSNDGTVVQYAISYFWRLKLPIRFSAIWQPDRAPSLFLWQGLRSNSPFELLAGVGAARPWRDPAWEVVPARVRVVLLARAGTAEAVANLRQLTAHTTDWAQWARLAWAEPVEPATLRGLLTDPDLELRLYGSYSRLEAGVSDHLHAWLAEEEPRIREHAARALAQAGDSEIIAQVEAAIRDGGGALNQPTGPVSSVTAREIQVLSTQVVKQLLLNDPRRLSGVTEELERRGEPLTIAQLLGEEPVLGSRALEADKTMKATLLKVAFRRVLQQDDPAALPVIVERVLEEQLPVIVAQRLWGSPQLLLALPDDVAGACVRKVEVWLAGRQAKAGAGRDERAHTAEGYKLLGMLARGHDAERLWQRFRAAEQPLTDQSRLLPVVWGVSRRCEELRELLFTIGSAWVVRGDLPPSVPQSLLWSSDRNREPCTLAPGVAAGVIRRPPGGGAVTELWQRLAAELEQLYSPAGEQRLRADLLQLREAAIHDRERLHEDRRKLVQEQAELLRRPLGKEPLLNKSYEAGADPEITVDELTRLTRHLELPGPELTSEDRAWVSERLADLRRQEVAFLVQQMGREGEVHFDGEGGPPARLHLRPPPAALMRPELVQEVRPLLVDPAPKTRHAAAWALWQLLDDAAASEVLLRDVRAADRDVRTAALQALVAGRHPALAELVPALLADRDAALRGIGLAAVGQLRLRQALPEVTRLVGDEDSSVADAALYTLVELDPGIACPMLARLAGSDDRLAGVAHAPLKRCHAPEHVDAVLEQLAAATRSGNEMKARGLMGTLSAMTWHLFGPVDMPLVTNPPPSAATVAAWRRWWVAHRSLPTREWVRRSLEDRVAAALEPGNAQATTACGRLAQLFELSWRYDSPPSAAEHELRTLKGMLASMELWEVLTSPLAKTRVDVDLLLAVDPERTRRWLVDGGGYSHDDLVRAARVDLGDPRHLGCEQQEQVARAWRAWARGQGWVP